MLDAELSFGLKIAYMALENEAEDKLYNRWVLEMTFAQEKLSFDDYKDLLVKQVPLTSEERKETLNRLKERANK